ncbi:MAG: AI-2E family transporter [Deltaproteobacteria bacterium]|nr:AI-2E family transporter [Deltaproteobacteria bacterium]
MSGYLTRMRRSHLVWQMAFGFAMLFVVFYAVRELKAILTPLVIAFLLAYLLDPVIDWFEVHGLSRTLGVVVLLVGVIVVMTAFVLLVIPLVGREFSNFGREIPRFVARIKQDTIPWVEQAFHFTIPKTTTELADRFGYSLQELSQKAVQPISGLAGRAVQGAYQVVMFLAGLVLIPFFTFFLLRDFDKMAELIHGLIPHRHRDWARQTWTEIDETLSGWIRGQLLVMLVLGTLYSTGYVLVGIPLGLVIGMLTGLMAFIPYLGAALGFAMALTMAFLDWQGWSHVFGVAGVFATVQTLDGLFITPNILGYETGLSPAVVVLALLVFGKLFGLVGVLLAVPVAGIIHVLLRRSMESYRASAFFNADAPDGIHTRTLAPGVGTPRVVVDVTSGRRPATRDKE